MWRTMTNFSTNSLALVLSSTEYNEKDYISDYEEYKVTEYYEEDNYGVRDYNDKLHDEYWIIYNIEGNKITYCKGYTSKTTGEFEILERTDKGLFIRKLMEANSEGYTRYIYYRLVKTNRRVYFISWKRRKT